MAAQPGDRFPSAAALQAALAGFVRDRTTLGLVAAAKQRIYELRHQLDVEHAPAGVVDALFTEARFGLRQAAAATGHPTDADAELAALIPDLIRWKIRRGDLGGAEALLDQSDDTTLRAELDATRSAQARALALAAGLDPARFVRMRRAMIIATFCFFAATTIGLTWALEDDISAYDHRTAFFVSLFAGTSLSAGALVLRRLGPDSLFNRVLSSSVPLSCAAVITNRALAWQTGIPLPAMLVVDLLLVATAYVGAIGWLAPRLQWAAVPYVAGAAWIALLPEQAVLVFAGAILAGIATLLALAWGSDDGKQASPRA